MVSAKKVSKSVGGCHGHVFDLVGNAADTGRSFYASFQDRVSKFQRRRMAVFQSTGGGAAGLLSLGAGLRGDPSLHAGFLHRRRGMRYPAEYRNILVSPEEGQKRFLADKGERISDHRRGSSVPFAVSWLDLPGGVSCGGLRNGKIHGLWFYGIHDAQYAAAGS